MTKIVLLNEGTNQVDITPVKEGHCAAIGLGSTATSQRELPNNQTRSLHQLEGWFLKICGNVHLTNYKSEMHKLQK